MNNRMMAVHSASFALRQAIRHISEANLVLKAVADAFSDALFAAREADHGLDLLSERVYLLVEGWCGDGFSDVRKAALSEAAYEALDYSSKALELVDD